MSVVSLEGVRKAFVTAAGTATVLDGVDLVVEPGEVVAIAGRSGSGKTVLLTLIAGWERPDAGTVVLSPGGDPSGNGAAPRWRDLAVVPQSLGLLDELTVDENITLPRRLDAGRRRDPAAAPEDVPELAARLGLGHLADRFPDQISRGEQQRVAIARAAALAPALLIADEPIAHQNEAWATAVMDLVADLAARGTACLLATHNPLALDGADRVLDLADGRLHGRTP
jgi:ABC-type lipoprotein export system ATPase subunit